MMRTYYVIDKRTNRIINAITTGRPIYDPTLLSGFIDAEHLYLRENPPLGLLQEYEFWDNRP